ncbi:TPA: hypothetical protein ACX6SK_000318 [Photobacterium damselae]
MLSLKRPEKPEGFDEAAAVKLKNVEEQIRDKADKINFDDGFWMRYKAYFSKAQHNKCAYCDMQLTENGDMEHYRPKSAVYSIKTRGDELKDLSNIRGRTYNTDCEYGYWWLAYDWNNYLFACSICNQRWKNALFPIDGNREVNDGDNRFLYKSPCKESYNQETPLLLNIFECDELSKHLEFTKTGLVKPLACSKHGKATIETVGLDRTSLVQSRLCVARDTDQYLRDFNAAESDREAKFIGKVIFNMGAEDAQFSGIVRIMFEQYSGLTWDDLAKYISKD